MHMHSAPLVRGIALLHQASISSGNSDRSRRSTSLNPPPPAPAPQPAGGPSQPRGLAVWPPRQVLRLLPSLGLHQGSCRTLVLGLGGKFRCMRASHMHSKLRSQPSHTLRSAPLSVIYHIRRRMSCCTAAWRCWASWRRSSTSRPRAWGRSARWACRQSRGARAPRMHAGVGKGRPHSGTRPAPIILPLLAPAVHAHTHACCAQQQTRPSRCLQVAWWLGKAAPDDAWYSNTGAALLAFAAIATGLAYVAGHAGTTEGGAWRPAGHRPPVGGLRGKLARGRRFGRQARSGVTFPTALIHQRNPLSPCALCIMHLRSLHRE